MFRASASRVSRLNQLNRSRSTFGAFRSFSKSDESVAFAHSRMLANAYANNHKRRGNSFLPYDDVNLKMRQEGDKVILSVESIFTQDLNEPVTTKAEMSKSAVIKVSGAIPLWGTFTVLTPWNIVSGEEWTLNKFLVERGQELVVGTDVAVFNIGKNLGPWPWPQVKSE